MSAKPMANGIEVSHTIVSDGDSNARSVAAQLERAHPAVDRVCEKATGDVTVWLRDDVVEAVALKPPEGWQMYGAFVSSNGEHGIRLTRSE